MKNITLALLFLGTGILPTMVNAETSPPTAQNGTAVEESPTQIKSAEKRGENANPGAAYTSKDFEVKPEWEKLFADHNHFSTTTGEDLYHTMCQACHMEDGQGASGAGDYPSFVGDERLRSPFYAIDVILNGFRGMPGFRDQLSDQQVADVVNYLRTSFGNQLDSDVTAEDVVRVRR